MLADEDVLLFSELFEFDRCKSSRLKSAMKVSIHELGGLQEGAQ
jgi:hypothetical protein